MLRKTFIFCGLACSLAVSAAHAQGQQGQAPGQDRVCLLTFNSPEAVAQGANVNIVRAQWLPRQAAEQQAQQHPERVIGSEQYGAQWDEALCQEFKQGNPT